MPRTHTWSPDRYLAYADERGRPFGELLGRIEAMRRSAVDATPGGELPDPRLVVDLGAGPATLTALLGERWPSARIIAVDSSPAMIERARRVPGIETRLADLRDWEPPSPPDVIVTNAALQWVPGHLRLLESLVDSLAPSGVIGLQVPGNFDEPSHTIRAELAARDPYAAHVRDVAVPAAHDARTYARALMALGCQVDAWETTYLHVLTGPDPVFDWVRGTGARPTLQALPDALRPRFEEEYRRRLREAYPADGAGRVILPFRRVFAVARRPV